MQGTRRKGQRGARGRGGGECDKGREREEEREREREDVIEVGLVVMDKGLEVVILPSVQLA